MKKKKKTGNRQIQLDKGHTHAGISKNQRTKEQIGIY